MAAKSKESGLYLLLIDARRLHLNPFSKRERVDLT